MTSLADATAAGEVTAVRPDGVAVTLPASSVDRALELGYHIEDAAGTAARKRHAEYGTVGAELGSAALGAARGLTFGLSDVALRQTGALTPEKLRAYQEESPTASTLGEYGGIAAGVLTPGAIGRVLGSGIRGAAAVGDLAAGALNAGTRAVGITGRAGVTGIALDALAGGAGGVARGAAEGAVYGAGQGVSNLAARDENELGHPAELAQVLAAHAGMGALLGGAISGTIGGATTLGTSAARRILRRLGSEKTSTLADAVAASGPVADDAGAAAAAPGEPVPPAPSGPVTAEPVDPAMAAEVAAAPRAPVADVPSPAADIPPADTTVPEPTGHDLALVQHARDRPGAVEIGGWVPTSTTAKLTEADQAWNDAQRYDVRGFDHEQDRAPDPMNTIWRDRARRLTPVIDKAINESVVTAPSSVEATLFHKDSYEADFGPGRVLTFHHWVTGQKKISGIMGQGTIWRIEVEPGQKMATFGSDSAERYVFPRDQKFEVVAVDNPADAAKNVVMKDAVIGDGADEELGKVITLRPVGKGAPPPVPRAAQAADTAAAPPAAELAPPPERAPALGAGNLNDSDTSKLDAPLQAKGPGKFAIDPLTERDQFAIRDAELGSLKLPGKGDFDISDLMRDGIRLAPIKKHIAAMDGLMAKSVATEPTTLFRGVLMNGEWAEKIKVGKVFRDKAYLSASTDSRVGRTFAMMKAMPGGEFPWRDNPRAVFIIRMRPGQNGLPVSELMGLVKKAGSGDAPESEVLLPRRTQLKITRIIDGPSQVGDAKFPPHKLIYADIMQVPDAGGAASRSAETASPAIVQPAVPEHEIIDIPHMEPVPLSHTSPEAAGTPPPPPPGPGEPAAPPPAAPPAPAPSAAPRSMADRLRDSVLGVVGAPTAAVTSLTSGVDQDFLSKLAAPGEAGKRLRQVAFEGDDIVSDQTRALTKTVTGLEDDAHVVMNATLGAPKAATMGNAMPKGMLQAQLDGAMAMVNRAQELIEQARDVQYEGAGEGSLKRFEKSVVAARVKLLRLGEEGEGSAHAGREAFTTIDTLKKRMGKVAKPGGLLSSDQAAVAQLFRDDYNSGMQKFLEDTELWGKAGEIQKQHNAFWTRLLDKKQVFDQTFMTDLGRYAGDEFWTTRRVADPARVHSFLSDAGHVRNDLKSAVAVEQVQSLLDFARSARDNFELSPAAHAAAERIIASAPQAKATIQQAIDDAGTRNLAKQLTGTMTGKAFALLARIDSTVGIGEPVRAELRAELRRAASRIGKGPEAHEQAARLATAVEEIRVEQVRQAELGNVGRVVRGTIRAFAAAVDRSVAITESGERIATPVAIGEGRRYALSLPTGDNTDNDDNEKGAAAEIKRRLRALHRFSGDPEKLYDTVHQSTRGVAAVAPQTAAELASLAGAAVSHLEGVAPRQNAPGLYRAADGSWAPTTAEAIAFDASLRAVLHPLSVADDLADGTLTRPGVQALKAVYPGLHDMIAAMLAVRLQQAKNVPLQRRLQLSSLFDLPTDGATDPGFAAMLQQGYAAPAAQPSAPHGGAFSQQDRAQMRRNVATATQRLG